MLIKPEPYSDEAVGRFEVPSGLYSLDVDFPANCATGVFEHPSLEVEVDPHAFRTEGGAQLLVVTLFALGVALLFWPDVRGTEEMSLQEEVRATYRGVALVGRSLQPLIALMKPLSSLRVWSYMWFMVLAIVWMIFVIITPITPMGLMVHVPKPGALVRADEPWNEPLVVRIDAQGNRYLNRQPVQFGADLGERLEKALSLKADWTVFVDGDPDVNVGDVIATLDLIHEIGGTKVVLVTPSMVKENPVLSKPPFCLAAPLQEFEIVLPLRWRDHSYNFLDVSFVVSEAGEVSKVKVQRSSGDPKINDWVVRSVRKWKYTPMPGCGEKVMEDYVPVYSW
jgi:biopolymer transport protein TolR